MYQIATAVSKVPPGADRQPVTTVTHNAKADQALALEVEARIAELRRYRRWYRTNRPDWTELLAETETELRGLIKLVRAARGRSATLAAA